MCNIHGENAKGPQNFTDLAESTALDLENQSPFEEDDEEEGEEEDDLMGTYQIPETLTQNSSAKMLNVVDEHTEETDEVSKEADTCEILDEDSSSVDLFRHGDHTRRVSNVSHRRQASNVSGERSSSGKHKQHFNQSSIMLSFD